jgi:hypothetical protein
MVLKRSCPAVSHCRTQGTVISQHCRQAVTYVAGRLYHPQMCRRVRPGSSRLSGGIRLTICSLMTLPSSSTVLIFCSTSLTRGLASYHSLQTNANRGQRECGAAHTEVPVQLKHSQSRRRWSRYSFLCMCRPAEHGKRLRLRAARGQQLLSTTDIWGLSALGCSVGQQAPGTYRKAKQQAGLAHAGVSNQQQLQWNQGEKWLARADVWRVSSRRQALCLMPSAQGYDVDNHTPAP